jgi:transportin-1
LTVSLDLISGMIEGLRENCHQFIVQTEPNFFQLLNYAIKEQSSEVKTSAFALLGDVTLNCWPLLVPNLPMLMPDIIHGLDSSNSPYWASPTNNAIWAMGEIAVRYRTA